MRFLALVQVEDDVPLAPCPWAPTTSTVGLALWPAATDVANPPVGLLTTEPPPWPWPPPHERPDSDVAQWPQDQSMATTDN